MFGNFLHVMRLERFQKWCTSLDTYGEQKG